jgi:hypothetical protein
MEPNTYIVNHPNYGQWVETMDEHGWTTAGRNWLEEAGGDQPYAIWLFLCNRRMTRAVGLGIFDIEDWSWADSYEAGEEPREAVTQALENAGMVL